MAKEKKKFQPPKSGPGDAVHTIVRAGLSAVPTLGGPATELFNAVIQPPLERRRQEWMEEVGSALRQLQEDKKINLEQLQQNEGFIDTLLHASQAALRNSQAEKRRALRNAILNSTLPNPPEHALQQMFINLVDSFTEWHLRILKLFHDPPAWFGRHGQQWSNLYMGGLSSVLENAFPELRGRREFYDQVWRELYGSGLVNTEKLHVTMTGHGLTEHRTTDLGAKFLRFIEDPF